jgi:hypothetical protein
MFFVGCLTDLRKVEVLPPHDLGDPRSIPVTRVEGYQNMFEKQTPKIDVVCILLLALFLVGLATYSVIIHILK